MTARRRRTHRWGTDGRCVLAAKAEPLERVIAWNRRGAAGRAGGGPDVQGLDRGIGGFGGRRSRAGSCGTVGRGRLRSTPGSLRYVGWSRHSSDNVLGEHADDRVPRHLVGAAADARQPDDCRGPPDMGSAEAEAGPETPAADDERVDPQGRPEGAEDRTVLYGN